MDYIEKITEKNFLLYLNIKPNSKKHKIVENEKYLTIYLLSKPIKNKANKELVYLLHKKLDISSNNIKISSGLKNANKIIQLNFKEKTNKKEIIKKLTK